MPRFHRNESAQGLIEFAIISMVLVLFFGGVVDFSRFMYYDSAIHNAARIGAETASNRCADHYNCNLGGPPTANLIFQNTECEASPYVALTPTVTTCHQTCTLGSVGCADPCPVASCPACAATQDICIGGALTAGSTITVSVGYNFRPFLPLMNLFFTDQQCWSTDSTASNHHTLCAESTGRATL